MAFFDTLKDKAIDLAQSGVTKSKQLAEIAKLTMANSSEEDNIKKAYLEIGKLYYAERGMAPEAAYAALCEKITTARVNIEENKARISELRKEGAPDPAEEPVIVEIHPEEPLVDEKVDNPEKSDPLIPPVDDTSKP